MSEATLTGKQVKKIIELLENTPSEQIQRMLASGLLTALRDANFDKVTPEDRDQIRELLGLLPRRRVRKPAKKKEPLRMIGTVSVPPMSVGRVRCLLDPNVGCKTGLALSVANRLGQMEKKPEIVDFAGSDVVCLELRSDMFSGTQLIKALGGANGVELSWPEICWLVEQFNAGQKELFLADGRENIIFVRDFVGLLYVMKIHFYDRVSREWRIEIAQSYATSCSAYSRVFFHAPRVEPEVGNSAIE